MNKYEELIEKSKFCKSREEIQRLAESYGIALSDEQCREIAGGVYSRPYKSAITHERKC